MIIEKIPVLRDRLLNFEDVFEREMTIQVPEDGKIPIIIKIIQDEVTLLIGSLPVR